jgi:hypothetical protein
MAQEISDFVKTHKAKQFLKDVKAPTKEKKSGDVGGLKLGTRDPESDKLAAKHTREIHGSREGNKDPKDGVKDSLDDPKNKRLKGHGRNEMGDPMYEQENQSKEELIEKHWIANAIKHSGALTKKAEKAKESPMEFAHEHEHGSSKTGKQSRLAVTLKKMHEGNACGESGADKDDSTVKKGKKLLLGDKLKEDTLANQIAVSYLDKRLNERSIVSGEHDVGCNPPDYTVGMETGKKPDAELQTDSKPITGKNEKSKKQNYKYGEVKK